MSHRFDLRLRGRLNEGVKAEGCEFERAVAVSWIGAYVSVEVLPNMLALEDKYREYVVQWDDVND